MKVICIDGKWTDPYPYLTPYDLPENVSLEVIQSNRFDNAYIVIGFEETKEGMPVHWGQRRFIPLSEIDENEFERDYSLVEKK
jgi:hypothetical protein